jgi:hypothetical protein
MATIANQHVQVRHDGGQRDAGPNCLGRPSTKPLSHLTGRVLLPDVGRARHSVRAAYTRRVPIDHDGNVTLHPNCFFCMRSAAAFEPQSGFQNPAQGRPMELAYPGLSCRKIC